MLVQLLEPNNPVNLVSLIWLYALVPKFKPIFVSL
jgi:hypothetical protein